MTGMTAKIQADFDRIALLSQEAWGHNQHYYDHLLRQIPLHCSQALEIGCGTGAFSRLLATRSDRVVALDLSPQMIRVARECSKRFTTIEYRVADAMTWQFPPEQFDCVASIATLHHLPFEQALSRMRDSLSDGGTLVILDLFQGKGLSDLLTSVLAIPVAALLRLLKTGRLRQPLEVRRAWAEHGQSDSYLTLSQIREKSAGVVPGARVRKHLLWRYSLTWTKRASPERKEERMDG